jgi:large subunit ribosomal protein L18
MNKHLQKILKRLRRHKKIRSTIKGTLARPRLNVFRSNAGLFLQLIDDEAGRTLVSASSTEVKGAKLSKTEVAEALGKLLAKKAVEKKIEVVVFDRGGYKYHGRVKAAADGAREGGLKF